MKLRIEQISMALGLIGISTLLIFARYGERDDVGQKEDFKDNYSIYSLPIPEHLDFAGEAVPLDDPQVVEAFDRELLVNTYWQAYMVMAFHFHKYMFENFGHALKRNTSKKISSQYNDNFMMHSLRIFFLLEHLPHCIAIVFSMTPISF